MAEAADHPGVAAPPPLIFIGFLAAGWALDHFLFRQSLAVDPSLRKGAALGLVLVGFLIEGLAVGLFRRMGTAVEPWKPSSALITTGLYRLSRNPIYVGFGLVYLGFALALNSPLAVLLLIPCLVVIDRFVIRREERYLQARFGGAYLDYRRSVRRWL